ncbi:MAG: NADH-quinone oxidoreductase subunit NuoF [Clostridiales bacterium]|nr:NADH-quinone oxidoreductase subunit NuoF [Clostridiales bacterium]
MTTFQELAKIKEATLQNNFLAENSKGTRIVVGMATCGQAAGAKKALKLFEKNAVGNDKVKVSMTGCVGTCRLEPLVEVYQDGKRTTYVLVDEDKAQQIYDAHVIGGKVVNKYTVGTNEREDADSIADISYYRRQTRVLLKNCGVINPEDINEYIAFGGYEALQKVLSSMTQEDVITTLLDAGLRGRGGGGFPTGLKWKFAMGKADQKYVICNADEGDPGAFMNRSVLEGDPHALLEAMTIAGYTIGATIGYIYIRAEYPVAVERLKIAINQSKKMGLLGKDILGSGVDFEIEIRLGAGAFVCGEETALIASIEGERGEPKPKPPFPAQKGAFGKPTVINNVGTFANIPQIITKGSQWFSSMGTKKSKGTKVFALGGKINNPGLVEVPMGTSLRDIIYKMGGGIPNGKEFKAAQTGGPSGGCIPVEHLDILIDYDSLSSIGTMMGSGGLIVMDEDNCMVDIARFFLDFTVDESCGKCVPCRIGTRRMREILDNIAEGKGKPIDLERLELLGRNISSTSLCGLGQTAPNPVLSTMKYFKDEYLAHINEKRCPASVCKELLNIVILEDKCIGCGLCAKRCPTEAISGEIKSPYVIDQDKCIKCELCFDACKFNAITKK